SGGALSVGAFDADPLAAEFSKEEHGINLGVQISALQGKSTFVAPGTNISASAQVDVLTASGSAIFSVQSKKVSVSIGGDLAVVKAEVEDVFEVGGFKVTLGGLGGIGAGANAGVLFNPRKAKFFSAKAYVSAGPGVGISVDIEREPR